MHKKHLLLSQPHFEQPAVTDLRTKPTTQVFWGMKKEKSHNLLEITLYSDELTIQIWDMKILSKINLHTFKNKDYSCCTAWLVKKGSHIHISMKNFFNMV